MKTQRGLTLLEILIASAIAFFLGIVLLNIWFQNSWVFYRENALINQGLSLNDTMAELEKYIQGSSFVVASYPSDSPQFTSSSITLILQLPAISESGILSNIYDYAVIRRDDSLANVLRMEVFPTSGSSRQAINRVLTSILQAVQFEYFDSLGGVVAPENAAAVGVTLTVLSQNTSSDLPQTSRSVVNLRNQ